MNESPRPRAAAHSGAAAVAALPWCCIGPAVLSTTGVALAGLGAALERATPVFLVVSLGFLGHALYATTVRRQGRRWVRAVVWFSTPAIIGLWAFRLGLV